MEENIELAKVEMYICEQCEKEKLVADFSQSKSYSSGHLKICKPCYNNNYRANKVKKRENPEWHEQEKQREKDYRKRHHEKNPESHENRKKYNRNYRLENLDKLKQYKKQWDETNKDYKKEQYKEWVQENKNHINEYRREYDRDKRKNNPQYRLRCALKSRLKDALDYSGGEKSARTEELLGCTYEFAVKYIESLWKPGMNWYNHGLKSGKEKFWEIDHIVCFASVDLTTEDGQRKVSRYTNLRPLWKDEHNKKTEEDVRLYGSR